MFLRDLFFLKKINWQLCACSAYRTALCKSKRGGFKDTHADDLLAPVLKVLLISNSLAFEILVVCLDFSLDNRANPSLLIDLL